MARLAEDGAQSLPVRGAALQLVERLRQRDWKSQVRTLHEFVRDRIRYVRDIRGVETVQTPEQSLLIKQGDCDDKSTLLASLLLSIGHPAKLHAIGFKPGHFSHVYTETRIGPGWVPLETTEPWPMGRAPGGAVEHMVLTFEKSKR